MKSKKGISLIVLVITIVVLTIIASAIILIYSNSIIDDANKSLIRNELSALQDTVSSKRIADLMRRQNIKIQKLSSLGIEDEKYEDSAVIREGELVILNNADDLTKEVASEMGILAKGGDVFVSRDYMLLNNTIKKQQLLSFKIYGNSVQEVEAEYQQLKYIQSTGTQYINTEIVPKSSTKMVCDFEYTSTKSGQYNGWGSAGSQEAFFFGIASGQFTSWVSSKYQHTYSGVVADTKRHTISIKSGEQKLDNVVYGDSIIGNTATSNQTIYLFALHAEWTTALTSSCSMKLYSCQIYDGETLVRDFIPCYSRTDKKSGLLDKVNNKFYPYTGTNDFIKGPEVEETIDTDGSAEIKNVGDSTGNLFDSSISKTVGVFNSSNNTINTGNTNYYVYDYIYVKAGTYTLQLNNNYAVGNVTRLNLYDINKNYLSQPINNGPRQLGVNTYNFTVVEDGYVRLSCMTTDNGIKLKKGIATVSDEPEGYRIPITIRGINIINEDKYGNNYSTITETDEYYKVSCDGNTMGINWSPTIPLESVISFQAKIRFISSEDTSIPDTVTLRIWNSTKSCWIHAGSNGYNTVYATKIIGEEKLLKLENVEITSSNYSKGDKIEFRITRGMGTSAATSNRIVFLVYKDTIMAETSSSITKYVPYVEPVTYNIYLDQPLRKVGSAVDYIDYLNKQVVRNVDENYNVLSTPIKETVDLPKIKLLDGITHMSVGTQICPWDIKVDY